MADEQKTFLNILIEDIEKASAGDITTLNILNICLASMKLAEGFPNLKGKEKKELVLQAIKQVLEKKSGDLKLCDILPPFIDSAIDLDKGKVSISIQPEEAINCCIAFLSTKKA